MKPTDVIEEETPEIRRMKELLYQQAATTALHYSMERPGIPITNRRTDAEPVIEKPRAKPKQIFWKRALQRTTPVRVDPDDTVTLANHLSQLDVNDYHETPTIAARALEPILPKQRLLILDLNGIFSHRIFDKKREIEDSTATRVGNFMVWFRPHTQDFFTYIFENFEVAIWSSVMRVNIEPLAKIIFGKYYADLIFIADQDFCEAIPSGDASSAKPIFLKNLDDLWEQYPQFDQRNTLIIDDSDEKMINNPVHCHFNPGTWKGDMKDAALSREGPIYRFVQSYVARTASVVETIQLDRIRPVFEQAPIEDVSAEPVRSALVEYLIECEEQEQAAKVIHL